jgi:hypothetical protein
MLGVLMLFDKKVDYVHLKSLMEMIRDNLILNNINCVDVSKIYKSFEWLQALEMKMNFVEELQRENEDLKEALENDSKGLKGYIVELENEIKELKKPKRKKRVSKK